MLTFMGFMKLIYGMFTAAFSDTDRSTTFVSVFHVLADSVQAIESTKNSYMTKLGKWTSLFSMAFFATMTNDRNQSMRHNSAKFCKVENLGEIRFWKNRHIIIPDSKIKSIEFRKLNMTKKFTIKCEKGVDIRHFVWFGFEKVVFSTL